jgi:2',3'-cyclic-nucleotide 2'-phosphodiesterase/3'-nucleotidase
MIRKNALFTALTLCLLVAGLDGPLSAQVADLKIFATSDVHNNYLPYDYFTDTPNEQYGLVKALAAVQTARAQGANVLLFDNGDNIQGNPLGEVLAQSLPTKTNISPIMALMNAAGYDAMALGNHEFNFGLPYLNAVIAGAQFPVVSANVTKVGSSEPYFKPYVLIKKTVKDRNGQDRTITIGVTGFVPPQILQWDNANLAGKVSTFDIYDAAVKYVPELKKQGADLVVLLAHTGLSGFPRKGGEENAGAYLTAIPGVDVVITGHSHQKFPSKAYASIPGVDLDKGLINGVPVVMPNSFADTIGLIDLTVEFKGGHWARTDAKASLVPVWDGVNKKSLLDAVPAYTAVMKDTHEKTLAYIRSPIPADTSTGGTAAGEVTAPLTSFFALVRDEYSVQIINEAQTWYAQAALKGTAYEKLPVLSAAAPFKAGGRQGPKYYTNVPAGPLAVKNMADLYVYPNTVALVKVTGAEVKEWLEMSAGQFSKIDPNATGEQNLVNDGFPTYNFDVIDGVTYRIDVTKAARYNPDGTLADAGSNRILDLKFRGAPVDPKQEFVVATNNYRSGGGGNFPNVNPSKIILASPDESRQVILKYIGSKGKIVPQADGNWSLAPFTAAGPVVFQTSPLGANALPAGVTFVGLLDSGYGKFRLTTK